MLFNVTHSIRINQDAPCEGPGQQHNNHPAASEEKPLSFLISSPQNFLRSDSCKAPFPCPKCLFPALRHRR